MEKRILNDTEILRHDARLYMELKGKKQMLDDEAKGIKDAMERLEQSIIERMTETEFDKFTTGGYTYSLRESLKASIPVAGRAAFYNELRQRDYDGLIKETIAPGTLNAFVKEQTTINGRPEWLEDNLNIFTQTKLSVKKS